MMTANTLKRENRVFRDTGGTSEENCGYGFRPAFHDRETGITYLSRFSDGTPAPCHLLDGLPDDVVVERGRAGRVVAVKAGVISGFVQEGKFFTREQAMAWLHIE